MKTAMPDPHDAVRRVDLARSFPETTCPASRHVAMIGETLALGKPCGMLRSDPKSVGLDLLAVVAALWEVRAERNAMREACERSERIQIEICRDLIMIGGQGIPDHTCEHCDTPMTMDESASCIADVQLCPQQAWGNETRLPNEKCYRHKFWR